MSNITIDGKEYDFDSLSKKAQSGLRSLQLIDQKLNSLKTDLVIYQAAAQGYGSALAGQLPEKQAHANKKKDVIEIDGKRYSLDTFSDSAKAELLSLQATNAKIASVQQELAIVQTARNIHASALQADLG